MLTAVPRSIFSWDFDVFDGHEPVGMIDMSWFIEGGTFFLNGHEFRLVKAGVFSRDFSLEQDGLTIADAQKTTFIRSFEVGFFGTRCTLRAMHAMTRRFVIKDENCTIGKIEPDHFFTRRCSVNLPDSIPLEVQFFMLWLTILMWRRAHRNNANAGAS